MSDLQHLNLLGLSLVLKCQNAMFAFGLLNEGSCWKSQTETGTAGSKCEGYQKGGREEGITLEYGKPCL